MRTFVGLLAASLLSCATGHAQVINGEGTYEGSSLHNPPPDLGRSNAPDTSHESKVGEGGAQHRDERK